MRRPTGPARLADVIDKHAIRRSARQPAIDLGTIQANGGLLLDTFSVPFPEDDYLIDERFTTEPATRLTGPAYPGPHYHDVYRAVPLAPLAAGDRVLVILLEADGDPIPYIIGRI